MKRLRYTVWFLGFVFCGWIGMSVYHYFLDNKNPELIVSGISNDKYYAGDISCTINGSHSYKVDKVSVFLDGTPLIYNFSINKKSFEHPFSINTRALINGKHDLKIALRDGTYHAHETVKEYVFYVDNTPLQVAFVKQNNESKVFQGRTLTLQFQASKPLQEAKVHAFSKIFTCVPEKPNSLIYEAFIPVDCEEVPNEYLFSINCTDVVENIVTLEGKVQVVPYPFKKQNLTISDDYAKQQKELGQSQTLLNDQLIVLAQRSPQKKLWQGQFCVPTEVVRVSTEFGVVRTTPVRGRYAHKAVDVVNHPRSIVWAPQDGVVVVKDRYGYSGNTVVIDHGCGILSLLYHLDSFTEGLEVGQSIKKGNPVGRIGMTGYAGGYHLHWEMRINDTAVDPFQWTKIALA